MNGENPDFHFRISVNYEETVFAITDGEAMVWKRQIIIGGRDLITFIKAYMRFKHHLLIGERMAEAILFELGSAVPLTEERKREVKGRNLLNGLPGSVEISSTEIYEVNKYEIHDFVREAQVLFDPETYSLLERLGRAIPPQLREIVIRKPITLTGEFGGLKNLDLRLEETLKLKVIRE